MPNLIDNYKYNFENNSRCFKQASAEADMNTKAHYSSNMKVKRPKVNPDTTIPQMSTKMPYSDKEANQRLIDLNTDIYESYRKEKKNNEFDVKLFGKIFIGFILAACSIEGLRRLIRFFKR